MAHKFTNPDSVTTPLNYHQSVEAEPGCRYLFVAGQTGIALDGSIPDGIEAQAELAFGNMQKVLAESGFGLEDVVFMKSFLTRREDRDGYQKVRASVWGTNKPASTFLLVSGLARPQFLVEVECIAAKKD
ncbi:MAG: enamine deaminase RidA [Rhodospirillaceae bacterium]|nr:enamine deaminase RidA [Rhodospirillaceae bacterium]|tara:strand:- start:13466 stop:13855 length:390 start_codon:yes stop_codon:yes gene_type:complete